MTTYTYERLRVQTQDLLAVINNRGAAGYRAVYLWPNSDDTEFDLIMERETLPDSVIGEALTVPHRDGAEQAQRVADAVTATQTRWLKAHDTVPECVCGRSDSHMHPYDDRAARQRAGDEAVEKMLREQSADGAKVHGY